MEVDIVHQDEWLIVLNKPTGLLSQPGRGPEKQDCLASRVQAIVPQASIVHRLDRDTSGLMVMALDAQTHRELSRQFEERAVEKTYLADVFGQVACDEGRIDAPLAKASDRPPLYCVDRQCGRSAATLWRVIERYHDHTRLECRPITGRSHQLRVHLRHLGHPILGDPLYGESPNDRERLHLHASSLTLDHPHHGHRMTWRAACPF